MRRINARLSAAIMGLFLVHMIWGVLVMLGITAGGNPAFRLLTWLMSALIALHILIGCKLTIDTLVAIRRSGVSYAGANRLFWIRRISGFAMIIFVAAHIWLFSGRELEGAFLMPHFNVMALLTQIGMVLSLLIHLTTNIRPLKIALGIEDSKNFKTDALIVLSVLLLMAGVAFFIYYLRWRAV
ncbi:MAG: pilus assembly protein PilX [Lachnospiraceae bacterium]|nr:pilus assembly protein PilX [Lachnospiraceae bacterium]